MRTVHSLRSLVAVVATALGFGVAFFMLEGAIGAASPWLGLLLMFYFMGIAKIGQPLVMLRVPKAVRSIQTWEISGPIYSRLAVYRFGNLLRSTPLRYLNSSVYLTTSSRDLRVLYRQAASAEAIHFWAAVLFTPYIAFVLFRGHLRIAAIFVLIQVLFNIYPIMHLRTLRGRLEARFSKPQTKPDRQSFESDA
jgi:Glycosyl-4,4'-diaponeurosporenoate acyltransferase